MELKPTRRTALKLAGAALLGAMVHRPAHGAPKSRWPNLNSYVDEVTGVRVYRLTEGGSRNDKIYQTHPQWLGDMEFFVFYSDRSGGWKPHALEMATGIARPLTTVDPDRVVLARKSDGFYFIEDRSVQRVAVRDAFNNGPTSANVGELPGELDFVVGDISLDAREDVLYVGGKLRGAERWALFALDVDAGEWTRICPLDFKIGHVQANPETPGLVMFCHETGGDAPQRMWLVQRDDGNPEPFYRETYDEWVTHETWWGGDKSVFTIWPYDDAHKEQPHGIFSVTVGDRKLNQIIEYPAWHTDGSPDQRWVMGDDFQRNIWLINPRSGERRLLTQGHKGQDFNTHPHASFTPNSKGIVLNSSYFNAEDILLAEIPGWDSLQKQKS